MVTTSIHKYDWQVRFGWALTGRSHVLITWECERARATIIDAIQGRDARSADYLPLIVMTPQHQGTDAVLTRAIATSAGLVAKRSISTLFRDFERYCADQCAEGRRVMLLIGDAHLLRTPMMRVLHSLSTIVVVDDLALQIVLVVGHE